MVNSKREFKALTSVPSRRRQHSTLARGPFRDRQVDPCQCMLIEGGSLGQKHLREILLDHSALAEHRFRLGRTTWLHGCSVGQQTSDWAHAFAPVSEKD